MMNHHLISSLLIAIFLPLHAFSQSTYLAYDGFSGDSNTPLEGGIGGQGWLGNWSVQNSSTDGYLYTTQGLTYSNIQTTGRGITGGQTYLTAGRNFDYNDGGIFDNYVTGVDGIGSTTGTTLWFSAILQKTQNNDNSVFFDLHNSTTNWCNDCSSNNRVGFGYFGTPSNVSNEKRWSFRIGSTVFPSSVPVLLNASALLVAKIDFNANNTVVSLYVNPVSIGAAGPPSTPTLTQTTTTLIRIRSLSAYLGDVADNGRMDEFRAATSYALATPDPSININLPPIASFTLIPNSGTAQLTVNVDASASSDPEGAPLTYTWNWGDGSANSTGVTATHTYPAGYLGIFDVTLTVKDNLNLSGVLTKRVTIFKADGTFPCQSSITMLNEATCGQANGKIRINEGLANNPVFTFKNSSGSTINATNFNEFHNLANGVYFTTVTGTNGCKDTYTLKMTTDSTTCSGWSAAKCNMQMGMNVNGLADWSHEHAFINRAKHVREELVTFHTGCNCWNSNVESELTKDVDGYPTHIPQTTSASATTYIRLIISSDNGNLKANEQYVFLYSGVGTFTLNGATVNSNTPGRLLFTVPASSGNIWLDISSSQSGNYMRNFRILKANEENVDLNNNIFNPVFLSRLSPFSTIRFMDWGRTNFSNQEKWSERSKISDRTYGTEKGVPYEMMIALANKLDKDIWICVPHKADSQFIAKMAELFRDNLESQRTIYLEYSNEVWNWIFSQAQYNNENRPTNLNYGRAYSEKANRVFKIWHSVFAGQTNRVKRVLGIQAGFNFLNEQILSQLSSDEWDLGSPTFYFGLDHGSTGNPVLNAASTAEDVNLNARNAFFGVNGGLGWKDNVRQDYRNIKVFGKGVVSYEGGQHYTDFTTKPYQQAMYSAQYLNSMYDLYNDVLKEIHNQGNQLAMAFTLSGVQESVYGSWGHLANMYMQPPFLTIAPKYQVCLDNSCLPFLSEANFPLAIAELTRFDVQSVNQTNALISWITEQHSNSKIYELERSRDGIQFQQIYSIASKSSVAYYQYLDKYLEEGVYYYRLKTNETDGSHNYSDIRSVYISKGADIQIVPNPSSGIFSLLGVAHSSEKGSLHNALGQEIERYSILPEWIDLSTYPNGVYYLTIGKNTFKLIKYGG